MRRIEILFEPLADGSLLRREERLHQLAFATHDHRRESFEPFPIRHVRFSVQSGDHEGEFFP